MCMDTHTEGGREREKNTSSTKFDNEIVCRKGRHAIFGCILNGID